MILKKRTKTGVTVTPGQTYKSVGLEIDRATPCLQLLPVEVLVCGYLEEKFSTRSTWYGYQPVQGCSIFPRNARPIRAYNGMVPGSLDIYLHMSIW